MTDTITDIGPWSEMKIEIVRKYAGAYASILAKHDYLRFAYIDAFAGAGHHTSRITGREVDGSPRAVLAVEPAFHEYHLVEKSESRSDELEGLGAVRPGLVHVYHGDANVVIPEKILPRFTYESYRRALLLVDPYSIDLDWGVIHTAGKSRVVDMFLNFMVMDANMNALLRNPDAADPRQVARMTRIWGDASWRDVMYSRTEGLFPGFEIVEKQPNEVLADAFVRRLTEKAGFKFAAEPLPVHNSKGPLLYYLFFASHNETAVKIANDIFKKYRR